MPQTWAELTSICSTPHPYSRMTMNAQHDMGHTTLDFSLSLNVSCYFLTFLKLSLRPTLCHTSLELRYWVTTYLQLRAPAWSPARSPVGPLGMHSLWDWSRTREWGALGAVLVGGFSADLGGSLTIPSRL